MTTNRLVLAAWLLSVAGVVLLAAGDNDAYSDATALTRGFGYLAIIALSAALCVSPLRNWLRQSAKLRRALGLAATSAAVLHAITAISSSPLSISEQFADAHLRFGIGAFTVLSLLAITSFPRAVTMMRLHSWKELHRLAYIAWICALLHGVLSPYAWLHGLLAIAATAMLLGLVRLWPKQAKQERTEPIDNPSATKSLEAMDGKT